MNGLKADGDGLASVVEGPEGVLNRIRNRIDTLLRKPQPALYVRHLRSVMALCDEEILRLQFAGTGRTAQTTDAKNLNVDLGPDGLNIPGTATLIFNGKTRFEGTAPLKPVALEL
jgi:hypothetical protein